MALLKYSFIVLFSILLMTGCATIKHPNEVTPAEQEMAKYNQLPSLTAISKATEIYNNAKTDQLDFYAPTHYAVAGKALEEAKNLLASGSHQQITNKAAIIDAILKNGRLIMRRVKTQLSDELTLRNKLDSLDSKTFDTVEYEKLLARLKEIIVEIENGNLISSEITRAQLLDDMTLLARRSIHFNAMNEPKEVLNLAKQLGGEMLAPITYQQALEIFNHTTLFIKQNPSDEKQISQAGKEALFAAKHALHITLAVTSLSKKIDSSAEQVILDEENRLLRILKQISDTDFRDHPIELQSSFISQSVKEKITELGNKEELILALQDTIATRDSSSHLSLVSATAKSLQKEKKSWLEKESSYELELAKLQKRLTMIEMQLNDTQNTIVNITTENIDITDLIEMKISETKVLEFKIEQSLLENEKNRQTILALQAEIAKQLLEKESQETKISALEQQLNNVSASYNALKTEKSTVRIERDANPISQEENRAKITVEETLQAIQSARELITIYRNPSQHSSLESLLDDQRQENDVRSDVLVDANQ